MIIDIIKINETGSNLANEAQMCLCVFVCTLSALPVFRVDIYARTWPKST